LSNLNRGRVATCLRWGGQCHMGFVANFVPFPAVQRFWISAKIWQSYTEFKAWNFFETQCRSSGSGSCSSGGVCGAGCYSGGQGSHASLKVLWNFFLLNSRPWKYLKTGQVLESPWISFHSSLKVLEFTKSDCAISSTSLNRCFA